MKTTTKETEYKTFNNRPLFPIVMDILKAREKASNALVSYVTRDKARKFIASALQVLSAEGHRQLNAQIKFLNDRL